MLVLSGGDNPDGSGVATDPTGQGSTLVMTRPDGSTYAFDDVTVSCKPPEAYGKAAIDAPGHIYMFSPIELTGPVDENGDNNDVRAVQPFVTFDGIVDKIQGDQTFTFPNAWERGPQLQLGRLPADPLHGRHGWQRGRQHAPAASPGPSGCWRPPARRSRCCASRST